MPAFRAIVERIAARIAAIPWELASEDTALQHAITYPGEGMGYESFIRRTLLDMLPLNFATYETAITDNAKFVLMQCFPAELFPLKGWSSTEPKETFRWVYHHRENGDIYLSDQKIAIFPSYGKFDITHDEMWGLPSPINQIMDAIATKLGVTSERNSLPKMDFVHIFDASLTLQKALEEIPEPKSGYASLWQSQFGEEKKPQRLSSGIIVPPAPSTGIILGEGQTSDIQGYGDWIAEATLRVLFHIYVPLLEGTDMEKSLRKSLGDCGGYEEMIIPLAVILNKGINRLMHNLGISNTFSFVESTPEERRELAQMEQYVTLSQLGEKGSES